MTISSHQVHSVLRTYGKQLRRGLRLGRLRPTDAETTGDQVRISPEAKRAMVVERVAADILTRMSNGGNADQGIQGEVTKNLSQEYGQPLTVSYDQTQGRFAFQTLDPETGRVTGTVGEEDTAQLNQKLVDITRQVVDQTMLKG